MLGEVEFGSPNGAESPCPECLALPKYIYISGRVAALSAFVLPRAYSEYVRGRNFRTEVYTFPVCLLDSSGAVSETSAFRQDFGYP